MAKKKRKRTSPKVIARSEVRGWLRDAIKDGTSEDLTINGQRLKALYSLVSSVYIGDIDTGLFLYKDHLLRIFICSEHDDYDDIVVCLGKVNGRFNLGLKRAIFRDYQGEIVDKEDDDEDVES